MGPGSVEHLWKFGLSESWVCDQGRCERIQLSYSADYSCWSWAFHSHHPGSFTDTQDFRGPRGCCSLSLPGTRQQGCKLALFCPWNGLGNVLSESIMASVLLDGTAPLSAAPTRETKDLRDTALFFQVQYAVKLKEPCFFFFLSFFFPIQVTSCNGPWKFEVEACHSMSE